MSYVNVLLFSIALALSSCTVAPKPIDSHVIALSGNVQDAGIMGGDINKGIQVRRDYIEEYNALVAIYGNKFLVPLKPIVLSAENTYWITAEQAADKATMARWSRSTLK